MENKFLTKVRTITTILSVFAVAVLFNVISPDLKAQSPTYQYCGPTSGGVPQNPINVDQNYDVDDGLMYECYENGLNMTLYSASEMGLTGDAIINSLAFYLLQQPTPSTVIPNNVTVFVKNTNITDLNYFMPTNIFTDLPVYDIYGGTYNHANTVSAFELAGWTVMETKTNQSFGSWSANSWIEFNSTTGFEYTGGNLLVIVYKTSDDYDCYGGPNFSYYNEGTTNMGIPATHIYSNWDGTVDNYADLLLDYSLYTLEGLYYYDDYALIKPNIRIGIAPPLPTGQGYVSSTVSQSSITEANASQSNVPVLKVAITTDGVETPLLNVATMNFNGVNVADNVRTAKLYYTAGTDAFSTSNIVGTYTIGSDNSIAFSGLTQQLTASGANYFWLAFDIKNVFDEGISVDASLANFTLSKDGDPIDVDPAPTNTNPSGEIEIIPIDIPPVSISVGDYAGNRLADTQYVGMWINVETSIPTTEHEYLLNEFKLDLSSIGNNIKVNKMSVYSSGTLFSPTGAEVIAELDAPVMDANFVVDIAEYSLGEGNNYLWLVFDIDYSSECDASIIPDLSQMVVADITYNKSEDFTTDLYGATITYNPIILSATTDNVVCETTEVATFRVNTSGSIAGLQWQQYDGSNWSNIDNNTNEITLTTAEIHNGFTRARLNAIAPGGDCIQPASIELTFRESVPVSNPVVTFNGVVPSETEPFSICMGNQIPMVVDYVGNAGTFEWQYLNEYGVWQNISLADVPTSNMGTMDFMPTDRFRETKIRVVVHSETSCGTEVTSAEYPIFVYYQNQFIEQPPRTANLCLGENLYFNVIFEGEEPISAKWYKDGRIINDTADIVSGMMNLSDVDRNMGGTYQYVVTVPGCDGIEVLYSELIDIFINPEPQIIEQTTTTRANIGKTAFLKIDANYTPSTTATEIFQWYRHYAVTGENVKLVENYNYQGTNSNILNIIPIDDDSYTFNNDYYFCVVNGMCGTGVDTSAPVYLFPGVEVYITKQPTNISICENELPYEAVLTLNAFSSDDQNKVRFQWYEGATELVDNTEFVGTTSNNLRVNVVDAARIFEKFVCKVWYADNDPLVDYILSDSVIIEVVNCPAFNVGINDLGNNNYIDVIPNPTADEVAFRFNADGQHNYIASIIDASGKLIYSASGLTDNGDNSLKLDVSKYNIANGTYFFTLNINGKLVSKSFVVKK